MKTIKLNYTEEFKDAEKPKLIFSQKAWNKYLWGSQKSNNEIGFYGVSAADNMLYLEDLGIVEQEVGPSTFEFSDEGVAKFMTEMVVNKGMDIDRVSRIMLHTHPGMSCSPSGVDETCFKDVLGEVDWSCMVILGTGGKLYARYQQHKPHRIVEMMEVQFDTSLTGLTGCENWEAEWDAEYEQKVKTRVLTYGGGFVSGGKTANTGWYGNNNRSGWWDDDEWEDYEVTGAKSKGKGKANKYPVPLYSHRGLWYASDDLGNKISMRKGEGDAGVPVFAALGNKPKGGCWTRLTISGQPMEWWSSPMNKKEQKKYANHIETVRLHYGFPKLEKKGAVKK